MTKHIEYSSEDRDYTATLDGQYIGSYRTRSEAQTALDNAAYAILSSAAAPTQEPAPVAVEAAPVVSAFPVITRPNVAAALRTARERAAADKAWMNALNKAAVELEAQPWRFNGRTLVIQSRTDSTLKHTTDGITCTCRAFNQEVPKPCWHRAACRLLARAAALAIPVTKRPRACGECYQTTLCTCATARRYAAAAAR